jgi:virulence factor Mce-like protein
MSVQAPARSEAARHSADRGGEPRRAGRDRLLLEAGRAWRPLAIYAVTLVGALVVTGFILHDIRISLPWSSAYPIRVAVDDAKGVTPGTDEVRIAGVPVGRITAVDLVRGRPVLSATIDPRYAPIYQDARLELRPQTALDDMYLDIIDRGHPSAGKLPRGQILSAERTQAPVDIGKVLDVFGTDTRAQMKRALDELSVGLPRHGADLRAAFADLAPFLQAAQRLTAQLSVRALYTRRLVHNMRLLMEELAGRSAALQSLVQDGSATFTTVARNSGPLDALIAALPPMLTQLVSSFSTLRTTLSALNPALDSLRPVAAALPSGLSALESLSQRALPAFEALDTPVKRLRPLARALVPTAASLRAAFSALEPIAPRLDRVTAAIVPCEPAVQKFFQWTPSVFKFSDAHGAYPRGESVGAADQQLTRAPSCADRRGGR